MISKVSFKDLHEAPNFNDLLEEYIDESANPLLPAPKYQADTYYALESAGVLHCLASYTQDSVLSGFLTLIVTPMPHYGAIIAASESYFVGGAYRQSGAGLKFCRELGTHIQTNYSSEVSHELCNISGRTNSGYGLCFDR
mgnify:CR=1 FL=1